MTELVVKLPDELAQRARSAGLLTDSAIQRLLEEAIRREAGRQARDQDAQRADELFSAMDRMAVVDEPAVMSPEEVAQEIAAMRAERRAKTAG